MPESFGARLRQRREERNILLSTVAEQTKIKLSLLDALERDDLSGWPSGIYRRAYVRAYGQAIGLSPDAVVREFLDAHPDSAETVPAIQALESAADTSRPHGAPPTRLRNIVGAAFGSLARLRTRTPEDEGAVRVPVDVAAEATPGSFVDPGDCGPVESEPVHQAEAQPPTVDPPPPLPAPFAPDLSAVARLCTELGRVEQVDDLPPLLQEAARILDASGLIVWVWDPLSAELNPALVHGYPDKVVAQLPAVRRDDDNATAEAFRLAETRSVERNDRIPGAVVAPLLTPAGCAGVLALELPRGGEKDAAVVAVATILAALLAQLIGGGQPAAQRSDPGTRLPLEDEIPPPVLRVVR